MRIVEGTGGVSAYGKTSQLKAVSDALSSLGRLVGTTSRFLDGVFSDILGRKRSVEPLGTLLARRLDFVPLIS